MSIVDRRLGAYGDPELATKDTSGRAHEGADAFRDVNAPAWARQLALLRRFFTKGLHINLALFHESRTRIFDKLFFDDLENARWALCMDHGRNQECQCNGSQASQANQLARSRHAPHGAHKS